MRHVGATFSGALVAVLLAVDDVVLDRLLPELELVLPLSVRGARFT